MKASGECIDSLRCVLKMRRGDHDCIHGTAQTKLSVIGEAGDRGRERL
jgi:hypothetical protein